MGGGKTYGAVSGYSAAIASSGPIGAILGLAPATYVSTSGVGQVGVGVGQLYNAVTGNQPSATYQDITNGLSTPVSTVLYAGRQIGAGTYQTAQQFESLVGGPGGVAKTTDFLLSLASAACHE